MNKQELEIKIAIGSETNYCIKTNIYVPLESQYYYIPTDYKEPLKVYLVGYNNYNSVDNIIRVMAVVSYNKKQFEVTPNTLFKSSDKAQEYYLQNKNELNYDFLKEVLNGKL